jgi:hypothetical protein
MSRTDKTISTNAFEAREGVEHWWHSPEASPHWYAYGMPTKDRYVPPARRGESKAKAAKVRRYWGGERTRVRMALLKQQEPEPSRTRRSVFWHLA